MPFETPKRLRVSPASLQEVYDVYLASLAIDRSDANPMRRLLPRADMFYSLLPRERELLPLTRILDERRPKKAKRMRKAAETAEGTAEAEVWIWRMPVTRLSTYHL